MHLFLVDPVVLGLLPVLDLALVEPESDLLLGRLNGIGAVADVAADVLLVANVRRLIRYAFRQRQVYLRWRSRRGWCLAGKPMGWWRRGWCGRS